MDNIGAPYFPVRKGVVRGFVGGDAKIPYIACNDIGVFAALVFYNPDGFAGQGINLIGDFVSAMEVCETLRSIRKDEIFRCRTVSIILMRLFAKEFHSE